MIGGSFSIYDSCLVVCITMGIRYYLMIRPLSADMWKVSTCAVKTNLHIRHALQ